MEINGDKFLRNLEIERERAELERQKELLMAQKAESYTKASNRYKDEESEVELNYQELDDIRLNKDSSNKQKYILLGFILVLLFLITIVIIKLLSDPKNNNPFGQNDIVDEKKMENSIPTVTPPQPMEAIETKALDIDKIIQSEDNVNIKQQIPAEQTVQAESKKAEGDIFGIAKEKTTETPKVEAQPVLQNTQPIKEEPKKATIKESNVINETPAKQKVSKETKNEIIKKFDTPIKTQQKTSNQSSNGKIYIQVGVFSSIPDKKLIVQMQANNYKYIFQNIEKDGKQFTKVLIGGYSSKDKALEDLLKIRQDINPKAFIPKGN